MMRRAANALVAYSSSEDEDAGVNERPRKKRKLPTLAVSLFETPPVDRPELHQGRIRTTPHVEGRWATHVYVSVFVERSSPLYQLLGDVFEHAKKTTPTLNSSWPNIQLQKKIELHISLSRPIYLWAHQRETFRKAVKLLSERFAPFKLSFVNFSELANDEHTRTFLTIEVGAGHQELRAMTRALAPALQSIRQKDFYVDARFHASIAWALLNNSLSSATCSFDASDVANEVPELAAVSGFPTISHLPKHLIQELNDLYSGTLSATKAGTFEVHSVNVKIGKEVDSYPLLGLPTGEKK